jgi:hypothetical protein
LNVITDHATAAAAAAAAKKEHFGLNGSFRLLSVTASIPMRRSTTSLWREP